MPYALSFCGSIHSGNLTCHLNTISKARLLVIRSFILQFNFTSLESFESRWSVNLAFAGKFVHVNQPVDIFQFCSRILL